MKRLEEIFFHKNPRLFKKFIRQKFAFFRKWEICSKSSWKFSLNSLKNLSLKIAFFSGNFNLSKQFFRVPIKFIQKIWNFENFVIFWKFEIN